jgi:hypothetical protein
MTRNKIIIMIAVLIILVAIFFYVSKPYEKGSPRSAIKPDIWPLSQGYEGEIVKDIQAKLNRIFWGENLAIDGKLGPRTAALIKKAVGMPLTKENYEVLTVMAS